VFLLNFETDLRLSPGSIPANITKRGLVDLYADDCIVRIVMPSEEKEGYAHVITLTNKEMFV